MGLLTNGYNMAMDQYRQLMQNQEVINNIVDDIS